MEFEALEPRDQGYAIAALAIGGDDAPSLAGRAPRGGGGRIESALKELLALGGADAAKQKLGPKIDELRRSGPGGALATVHPSWLADALADEPDETVEAVLHVLPDRVLGPVRSALAKLGRPPRGGLRPEGLKAEFELILAERWRRRAFPHAGASGPGSAAGDAATLAWLFAASSEEIELVAREVGIRGVARAFCGISREDLAKLCHGLPATDSVRLVSAVVELRDKLPNEELRKLQKLHLKLLKAGGVSPALFSDAGLSMLAEAVLSKLDDRARHALAYRLPDALGRRLLDLAAPGARLVDEATREAFVAEFPAWLKELAEKGLAASYGGRKS